MALIETLDQDGAEPVDRPPAEVNELHLTRHRNGSGGRIAGRFDDAAMIDAIATVVDAKSAPVTGDDERTATQRQQKRSLMCAVTSSTTATGSPSAAATDRM